MANAHDSAEWRVIPGWPDYQASSDGQIRRHTRPTRGVGTRKSLPYLMAQQMDRRGYMRAAVRDANGKKRPVQVHRLVALAFLGQPPEGMHEVAHNDGVRNNNSVSNLRWDTSKGNLSDRVKHGTLYSGAGHHFAKLTEAEVRMIRAAGAAGQTGIAIAARHNISKSLVSQILRRSIWRHVE